MIRDPEAWTPDVILAAYEWRSAGTCFRCKDEGRAVAVVATVRSMEFLMCGSCVLREEERRRTRAVARGLPYAAGRIGQSPRGRSGENPGR